jgi:uncharacterized membrane protein YdjX (TVP38/TMEM64 family)
MRTRTWLGGVGLALLVVAMVVFSRTMPLGEWLEEARGFFDDLGPLALAVYAVVYALATVLVLPGAPLTLFAAAAFGLARGFLVVLVGANLGAFVSFVLARRALRSRIELWLAERPIVTAIDRAVSRLGWRAVLLTRLSPLFPFSVQNYAYGLTGVSTAGYVLGTLVGMLPGILLYVLSGVVGVEGAASISQGSFDPMLVLYLLGIAATLVVGGYVAKVARSELRRETEGEAPAPALKDRLER